MILTRRHQTWRTARLCPNCGREYRDRIHVCDDCQEIDVIPMLLPNATGQARIYRAA